MDLVLVYTIEIFKSMFQGKDCNDATYYHQNDMTLWNITGENKPNSIRQNISKKDIAMLGESEKDHIEAKTACDHYMVQCAKKVKIHMPVISWEKVLHRELEHLLFPLF